MDSSYSSNACTFVLVIVTKTALILCHPIKFGIPILKQYNIYALDTIFLELGSEDKVKITVTPETVCDTLRPKGVSTH